MVENINFNANKIHNSLLAGTDGRKVKTEQGTSSEEMEAPEVNKNVMSAMDISRFVDSVDEMSSALSQFYGRILQEKFNKNLTKYSDKILDEKNVKKVNEILRSPKISELNVSELLFEFQRRYADISDLVLLLRGLIKDKRLDDELKEKLKEVLEIIEKDADPKELKAGINCALKAKIFGKHLSLRPSLLRAAYRQFITSTESSVDFYENLISTFGYKKRRSILEFLEDSLLIDIASQDPSSSTLEFGYLVGRLKMMRQIKSAENIFIEKLMNNKLFRDNGIDESNLLSLILSVMRFPEYTNGFITEIVGEKKELIRSGFYSSIYSAIKELPENIFGDEKNKDLILNQIIKMENSSVLHDTNKVKKIRV
ncbi:TPA: type III secretion system gatekeeper subunit SctW [Escherichia coli]|uniref:type III secretion system gatekeeper subunit SctW n=1 Tax=Escherichia coli TaxID=562 RepID=UPI000E210E4B|nr:type III secretion system gatekeeper subunit SctW [Escherichia coli]